VTKATLPPEFERLLNFIGMIAMVGVLLGGFIYQFWYHELPCTLCQLQRLAMIAVAFGAAMNLMLGPDPRHYGVCLVSAVFGAAVSIRQTFLHINPFFDTKTGQPALAPTTNPPFGEAVMGFHLYVWGVVTFGVVILAVGVVLLFRNQFKPSAQEPAWLARLAFVGVGILFAVASLEVLNTFLECGIGDCPNDGRWNWWILR
jgi:disulfide bond formation protein DsbB